MKKNENYPKYVQAMRMLDKGASVNHVCVTLKMAARHLKRLRAIYLKGGELALLEPPHKVCLTVEQKVEILEEIERKGLSLVEASILYNTSHENLRTWSRLYHEKGAIGLERKGSRNGMKKKRQRTEAEMDELEMLRKRNEYLEAENALLKKVKALVEEREARLHAIGRGPSKN
ncbi:MAG: hypothetical protein IJU63_00785 [Bacteroidales bacterium]|nr:hypothetical protein [Bacteroidales bacterium]